MSDYHYLDNQADHLHHDYDEDEVKRLFGIAEWYATCCKARGVEPPPTPQQALLCAAEALLAHMEAIHAGHDSHGATRH